MVGSILTVVVGLWVSVALHELAHAAVGAFIGRPVLAVGTGRAPFLASTMVRGTKVYVGCRQPLSGVTLLGPAVGTPQRLGVAAFALAGPTANLWLAWLALEIPALPANAAALLSVWNLFLMVRNLIPSRAGVWVTDGGVALGHAETSIRARWDVAELSATLGLGKLQRTELALIGFELGNGEFSHAAEFVVGRADAIPGEPEPAIARISEFTRAAIDFADGRTDLALSRIDKLLSDSSPDDPLASALLSAQSQSLARLGRIDEARVVIDGTPEGQRPNLLAILEFEVALRLGDAHGAELSARAMPQSWLIRLDVARVHHRAGDSAAALASVEMAERLIWTTVQAMPAPLRPMVLKLNEPAREFLGTVRGAGLPPADESAPGRPRAAS